MAFVFTSLVIFGEEIEIVFWYDSLEIYDLDKVLGMDYLTTCDATVDCFAKIVKIHILIRQSLFGKGLELSFTLVYF